MCFHNNHPLLIVIQNNTIIRPCFFPHKKMPQPKSQSVLYLLYQIALNIFCDIGFSFFFSISACAFLNSSIRFSSSSASSKPICVYTFIVNEISECPYDDYDELRKTLADYIPEFNMKLKLNSATGRYEFSADIDSVFDIAWYTLAIMISEDSALENRVNNDSRPD